MQCAIHPQQQITNFFVPNDPSKKIQPMCPLCVEDHSSMKKERGEYISSQNMREDAMDELRNLKQKLAENIRNLQNQSVMNQQNSGQDYIDSKLGRVRQILMNQVDFVINQIKQDIGQDVQNSHSNDQLLSQFMQDQNYLNQLENEMQRKNQQAIVDFYQNSKIRQMQNNFKQVERSKSSDVQADVKLNESLLKDLRYLLSDIILIKSSKLRNSQQNDNKIYSKDYVDDGHDQTVNPKSILKTTNYNTIDDDDSDSDDCEECKSQRSHGVTGPVQYITQQVPQILTHTQPIITQPQPIITQTQPIITQTQPIVTQTQPILTQTQPIMSHPQSVVSSVQYHHPVVQSIPVQMDCCYDDSDCDCEQIDQKQMVREIVDELKKSQQKPQTVYVSQPQPQPQQVYISQPQPQPQPQLQRSINIQPEQTVTVRKPVLRSLEKRQTPVVQQKSIVQQQQPQILQQSYQIQQPKVVQQSYQPQQLVSQQVRPSQIVGGSRQSLANNLSFGQIGRQAAGYSSTRQSRSPYTQSGNVLSSSYNQYGLQTNQPQHQLSQTNGYNQYGLSTNYIQPSSYQLQSSQQVQPSSNQQHYIDYENVQVPASQAVMYQQQYDQDYQKYDNLVRSRRSSLRSSQSNGKQVTFQDQILNGNRQYSQNQIYGSQII